MSSVIDFTYNNLRDYYDSRYTRPKSDSEAIETIANVYQETMGNLTPSTKTGIAEVYRELLGKGLPSYYWMLEAIHRTSKKRESKKSFPYIVGTLRNWALYGFGNTLTNEEEEIYDYFTEITGLKITPDSRKLLSSIIGTFGAFKLMRTMPELKDVDMSLVIVEMLGRVMREKYMSSEQTKIVVDEIAVTIPPVLTPAQSVKSTRTPNNNTKEVIREVVELLKKSETALRPTDIAKYLNDKGFSKFNQKNMTSQLMSFMNSDKKIVKIGTGKYWHRDNIQK